MKKHLPEEKIDLSQDSHNIFLFLTFFFAFNLLNAQINTNGFINVDKIDIPPDFNQIYDLDFDDDKLIDLLLINKSNRDYSLIRNLFTKNQKILANKFWLNLNSITKLKEENNQNYYLITSRKNKSVNLGNFTNYGSLIIKESLVFNSYPSNCFIADFRNNGRVSAVVYGAAFNGLSLVTEKKLKLSQKVITDKNSYSHAFPNDFNGDSYLDIAALNSKKNSLEIFSNDQEGNFYLDRKFNFSNKEKFQIFTDLNNDSFSDLVTSAEKEIHIYYGDSVYSFENRVTYSFKDRIKKVIAADINYNSVQDFIFINEDENKIFLSLSNSEGNYQKPICLLNGNSFKDIKITRKGILNRLLAIDSSGKLFSVSYTNNKSLNFDISLSDSLTNIFSFKNLLGAISPSENKFYLIKNENRSLFYYDYKLSKSFNNVFVDTTKNGYQFYFYDKQKKFIEILKLDNELKLLKKSNFYLDKEIVELVKDNPVKEILVFLKNKNSLYFKNLHEQPKNNSPKTSDEFLVSNSLKRYSISNLDTTYLTFIDKQSNDLQYNLSTKYKSIYKDILRIKIGNLESDVKLKSFSRNGKYFSITNIDNSLEYLVHNKSAINKFKSDFQFDPEKLQKIIYKKRDRFIYLDEKRNELYWVKISLGKRIFIREILLKNIKAKEFTSFIYNNFPVIVYFDTETKLLNFRRIPFNE